MKLIATILVVVVVALHLGFMVMEIAYWDHDIGRKIFSMTPEFSKASQTLAANQGVYNGLLAAGIGFAFLNKNQHMLLFLLGSAVVAGLYGGFTVKPTIYLIQALPAALAFAAVYLNDNKHS